jgi:hypothetical protein
MRISSKQRQELHMRAKSRLLKTFNWVALFTSSTLICGTLSHAATKEVSKQKQPSTDELPAAVVDTPKSFNFGALLGIGLMNKDLGNQLTLGVDGAYQVSPNFQVGGYLTYNSISQVAGISSSLFTLAPEASYILTNAGILNGLRVGGKAGLSVTSLGSGTATVANTTITAEGDTSLGFVIGPHLAYDAPINKTMSIGAEANYLIYTSNDGFNAFNVLAAFKFHQ